MRVINIGRAERLQSTSGRSHRVRMSVTTVLRTFDVVETV